MTFQWGNNPEHTISTCINWDYWAFPFCISWWNYKDASEQKCLQISINFLCFIFSYERWIWKK